MPHSKSGYCGKTYHQWTYDIDTDKCLPFAYGGCEGNENRFNSLWECRATCIDIHL